MNIEDIVENFPEQREIAINGHPVTWGIFQDWERYIAKLAEKGSSYGSFRNFRVVHESGDIAMYADGKWDENKALEGSNIKRTYLESFNDTQTASEYCNVLNAGDVLGILKAQAEREKMRIHEAKWAEWNESLQDLESEEEEF